MKLKVMYWNIWLDNQIYDKQRTQKFLKDFKKVIKKYNPDCIGLNEVSIHDKAKEPLVFDLLDKLGYVHKHFVPASPYNNNWTIGAGLVSKFPINSIKDVVLSEDPDALKRGFNKSTIKAITAKIILPKKNKINIIVAHPIHWHLHTRKAHLEGITKIQSIMRTKEFKKNTILGGDFNESIFWSKSFYKSTKDILNCKTGTLLKPTWIYEAKLWAPLRINLDQIYWTKESTFSLINFEVISSNISDHRPIFAEFNIK